jgi:hypothetical protein
MKIKGQENISDIFSIFHDGKIVKYVLEGDSLQIEVKIKYLAQRIDLSFSIFSVRLIAVSQIRFCPWSNAGASAEMISDLNTIFDQELEILEGNHRNGEIEVICVQHSPKFTHAGGELYLIAESAEVKDEVGRSYSLEELGEICKGYWNYWENEHKT